jgi:beta-lactam-binding protein with PASTA domain
MPRSLEQLVDNRYRILRPLGSGGMAEVYLAHDDVLDRDVALKVMSGRYSDDDEFVERFKREAQSAAALSHPNIVSIYDRGESESGTYYIAMEYLPGGTLKDRILQRGALPPRTAAAVALQIAEALRAAHEAGVVHRDIKPHNVLVTESGDIKVGDFGIARAATSSTMTKTGSILGTAHYISPEQAMGELVGFPSDLYSLGVVLYEMLTGTLPYDAETSIGIAMKHVNGHLVPPRELNPEIPKGINAITTQLLAKNPNERYADASELIKDLERVLEGLVPAAVSTTRTMSRVVPAGMAQTHAMPGAPVANRDKRRQRWPWAPILLLILLFLAMLGGLAYTIPKLMAEEITVPDLVGYASIEEAQGAIGDNFKVKEGDRVSSKEPIDTIVSQNPKAGETANQGSTIFVNISGTQVADLPDVEGKTRDEAVRILEEAGFKVEEATKESSVGNEGYVVDQTPRGGNGQTADAASTVKITVGAGPETIQVPDLYNLTPENAKQALEKAGLKLGSQKEQSSSGVASGAIVSQNPTAGSSAKSGSSVDITVSSGPKQIPVPNVVGSYLDAATQTIWNAGFAYTVETIQSDQPAGLVVSTDPPAGTQLDPNSRNVTIRQSAGPPPPAPPPPQAAPPPPPPSPPPANKTGDSKTGDSKSAGSGKSGGNGK